MTKMWQSGLTLDIHAKDRTCLRTFQRGDHQFINEQNERRPDIQMATN